MAVVQIQSVNWWHEQFATWMIANPSLRLTDAATHFGKTITWISIVKNSDAFKIYFANRVKEQFDMAAMGITTLEDKTAALTEVALEKLMDRVDTIGDVMTAESLLAIADTGLKRLGYGANKNSAPPGQTNVQVNVVVGRDELENARRRMHERHGVQAARAAPGATLEVSPASQQLVPISPPLPVASGE